MARPREEGLFYFPHDVYASSDEKIEPLILLYGARGYAFYFLHLEYMYRNSECELDISDAETRAVIQQKLHINEEEYNQILQTALKKHCFDKEYYEQTHKLTSNGAKKRAAMVTRKRDKSRSAYFSKVSATETPPETPERKEKKTKENKIKENIKAVVEETAAEKFFEQNIGLLSGSIFQEIDSFRQSGIEEALIIRAIKEAVNQNVKRWAYIKTILQRCLTDNIKTLEKFEALEVERKASASTGNKTHNSTNTTNFGQRQYDDDFFEKCLKNGGT